MIVRLEPRGELAVVFDFHRLDRFGGTRFRNGYAINAGVLPR
jgi:hypothetical protein